MKYAKMLGIAALAALALMAVVGASSASAKVCSGSGTGIACEGSHGKVYTGAFAGTATNAILTSTFTNVSCTHSVVGGTITNGETGTGDIESLTFTGCTSSSTGNECKASTNASSTTKWHSVVSSIAGTTNGTMTVENVFGTFVCDGTTCNYGSAKAGTGGEIVITGGAPAEVHAKSVKLERKAGSGFLCSSTALWHGDYAVTNPTSLYIT